MLDKLDKLTQQQRLFLAIALSFLFFVGYQYFILSKYPPKDLNQTAVSTKQVTNNQAPKVQGEASPSTQPKTAEVKAKNNVKYIAEINSKHYSVKIDNLGRVGKFYLNDKKFTEEDGKQLQLIDESFSPKPLEIRFSDGSINDEAFRVSYVADVSKVDLADKPATITLTQKLSSLNVVKKLTFYPDGHYGIALSLSDSKDFFISPGSRPNVAVDGYTFHGILLEQSDETLKVIDDGDTESDEFFNSIPLVAAADRYYTTMFYSFENPFGVVVSKGENADVAFVKGKKEMNFSGYIGAKDHKVLNAIGKEGKLTKVIEYGWFTFIAKPVFTLLNYIHSIIGNWGWSIVLMTILIRVVLFPLTYKGMVSMNKLKELSPRIKELQAKYKGEPQKLNMHMMELYKKHGANPMGGCLPILLQIPVFFAIYRVLQNAVELKDAPWVLWVQDLSVMDPYFILPVAMGITMFIHQRLTPTNFTDPMQEKIMKFLPLIFTFFFVTFPAGLTLYWFINNIFSILQQMYVNRLFDKKKEQKAKK